MDAGIGRDGDEEDSVLGDFIEDEDTISPEESATNQLLKEKVAEVLSSLSDREQKIVRMRFGLDNGKNHTLEEVGQEIISPFRHRIGRYDSGRSGSWLCALLGGASWRRMISRHGRFLAHTGFLGPGSQLCCQPQ